MTESEKTLEVFTNDSRSVEGARALGLDVSGHIATPDATSDLWASKEFEDMDPREAATRAAIRDARLPDRLFRPGGYQQTTMKPGTEYSVR